MNETDNPGNPAILYCVNHPQTETNLRCNKCERPICPKCAVLTPTGYRCKDCVRGQQKSFDTTMWWDYPVAFLIALNLAYVGCRIAITFGFFTIFLAPIAGMIIAEVIRFGTRKRRSPALYKTATIGAALGSLVIILREVLSVIAIFSAGGSGQIGVSTLLILLWPAIFTIMVPSLVYYRLSGIELKR